MFILPENLHMDIMKSHNDGQHGGSFHYKTNPVEQSDLETIKEFHSTGHTISIHRFENDAIGQETCNELAGQTGIDCHFEHGQCIFN